MRPEEMCWYMLCKHWPAVFVLQKRMSSILEFLLLWYFVLFFLVLDFLLISTL